MATHRFIPAHLTASSSCCDGIVHYGINPTTGRPEAKAYVGKRSKCVWHFAFKTVEARQEKIAKFLADREACAKIKTDRAEAEKARKRSLASTLAVGTVLYRTWGYDQTNVDFYQVVALGKASIQVRKIGYSTVTTGFDCGQATPTKDKFIGEVTRVSPTKYSILDRPSVGISWYA